MNPNEVRIGNYMQDREDRLCIVEEINKEEFKAPAIYGGKTSLPNRPVPITEEWLIKLGFTEKYGLWSPHNCWHKYAFRARELAECGTLGLQPGKGDPVVYALLYYVNEIQNLHFAFTGKELTFKK